MSPSCAAYCPERRGDVRCGCRKVSPSFAPDLSGEAPWVACTPVGDGPVECAVVPHLAEDPVVVLAPLC